MLFSSSFRLGACGLINVHAFTRTMCHSVARRPVKIVNLEKISARESENKSVSLNDQSQAAVARLLQSEKLGISEPVDDETDSQEGPSFPHVKGMENDLTLSRYMLVVKSRTKRRKAGIILLEGKKLINDALASDLKLEALFVSQRKDIASLALPCESFGLYQLPYKYFKKWSDVVTPAGVLGIFRIPSHHHILPDPKGIPLKVICDNIRDPGNMGAILRTLAGVGCQKIVVTKEALLKDLFSQWAGRAVTTSLHGGIDYPDTCNLLLCSVLGCVDIWEPKVLRAACGGHFRVPIEYDKDWKDVIADVDDSASVFLADCDPSGESSANSISERNNRSSSYLNGSSASGSASPDDSPNDNACIANPITNHGNVQSLPYYDMKFKTNGSNILVVSNESSGVSPEALAFTASRLGVKVHIPLCGNVESLNVGSALSVIAFEMKRQAALFNVTT